MRSSEPRSRILAPVLLALLASVAPLDARAFTLGGDSSIQRGWRSSTVTFKINYTDCGVSESVMNRAIDAAVEIWNSIPTSGLVVKRGDSVDTLFSEADAKLQARTGGNPTDLPPENPEILCNLNFEADTGSPAAVVGGTTQYIAPTTPYLEYAYITLNSEPSAEASISSILETSGETQLAILIAHEMGHALGLGHTADEDALMYFNISEKTELALSQDDIDGMTYLYPREEFGGDGLFGCGTLRREEGGGQGPGPGGAAGAAGLLGILLIASLWTRLLKTPSARV